MITSDQTFVIFSFLVPTEINYKTPEGVDEKLVVTTITAGHCIGSVMFLLEQNNKTILYTGDFRLNIKIVRKIRCLQNIKLDKIFLDSTFFNKSYFEFPMQFESADKICELIKEWIDKGKNYIINLKLPARYGSEYLFKKIAEKLKKRVNVSSEAMSQYKHITELDNCVTDVLEGGQIFVKNHRNMSKINQKTNRVKCIKPTAMYWREWSIENEISEDDSVSGIRVCYSSHSSYSEIKDILLHLKPTQIYLNVVPAELSEHKTMLMEVRNIQKEYLEQFAVEENNVPEEEEAITFRNILLDSVEKRNEAKLASDVLNCIRDEDGDEPIEVLQLPKKRKQNCA